MIITATRTVEIGPYGTAIVRALTRGEVRRIAALAGDTAKSEAAMAAAIERIDWSPAWVDALGGALEDFNPAEDLDNSAWSKLERAILDLSGLLEAPSEDAVRD